MDGMRSSKKSKTPVIQERDIAILTGFFDSRIMTASHVAALYFAGRREAAKKRLQALKRAGLISERPRQSFEPAILFLTRSGIDLLRQRGVLIRYPYFDNKALERRARVSETTIRHELAVMDVKATLCAALEKCAGLSISEFTTWPLLTQFESDIGNSPVKPDGFARIDGVDGKKHALFIELDRSTETQSILVARAQSYLRHYMSGRFAKHHGASPSAFKSHPFRVLYVLQTEERRNNTAESLLRTNPPILSIIWLTTIREILADPLGPIWVRPVDYRDAVRGTEFDTTRIAHRRTYRRETAREESVASRIHKHQLIPWA